MKKVFNWSEVHSKRSNFLQNPYFRPNSNQPTCLDEISLDSPISGQNSISPDNDSPNSDNESMSSSIDSNRPNSNQPTSVDEISLADGWLNALMQRMLITFGLSILRGFSNEFTYWSNFIANIIQCSWASFIQACNLSIEVIRARLGIDFFRVVLGLGEIAGGVSAREILKVR